MLTLFLPVVVIISAYIYFFQRPRKIVSESVVAADKIIPVEPDWKWDEVKPLPIRPFVNKRNFNVSLGIRNLAKAPHEWLLIENTYLNQTKLRKHYTEIYPDKTTLAYDNPHTSQAIKEFYDTTIDYLLARFPKQFVVKSDQVFNTISNEVFPRNSQSNSPSELVLLLAYLIEEDFLLLIKDDPKDPEQEYKLRASVTGFPAGFDPSHGHNQPISYIHGPVPQYKERLKSPMASFFNKLQPKDLWVRHNWSIQTYKSYFSLSNHGRKGETVEALKYEDIDFDDGCFLRVERQCFTRLPKSRANVMTVRTYLTPIKQVKAEGLGPDLIRAIDLLPPEIAFYKKRDAWGEAVKQFLSN